MGDNFSQLFVSRPVIKNTRLPFLLMFVTIFWATPIIVLGIYFNPIVLSSCSLISVFSGVLWTRIFNGKFAWIPFLIFPIAAVAVFVGKFIPLSLSAFYPGSILLLTCFFIGKWSLKSQTGMNGKFLLFIGTGLFFSSICFSYIENETWGVWGRIFLYLLAGLCLGPHIFNFFSFILIFLCFLPFILIQVLSDEPDSMWWLFFIYQPLISLASFFCGLIIRKSRSILSKSSAIIAIFILVFSVPALVLPMTFRSFSSNPDQITINEFKLLDTKSDSVSFNQEGGSMKLISFWSSRCKPCIEELVMLEEIQKKLSPDKCKVMGVNCSRFDSFDNFLSSKKFHSGHIAQYYDFQDYFGTKLNIISVPVTILLDENGNVIYQRKGYFSWAKSETEREILDLIRKR